MFLSLFVKINTLLYIIKEKDTGLKKISVRIYWNYFYSRNDTLLLIIFLITTE